MIDTKLILIEGVPCSGKSTTAEKIWTEISECGYHCEYFLEWADENPIPIGNIEDLSTIISTTKAREHKVLHHWKKFTEVAKQQETIYIIESRFWQTDGMYLYLSGYSEEEILENNQSVIAELAELDPVLVYLAPKDIERLHTKVAEQKNEKWRRSGRDGSWEEWGNKVYEQQKWFKNRMLDSKEMDRFFSEWASIAEILYGRFPFRKIKIQDPQIDWEHSMGSIRDFLEIGHCP